ncbi:MAG: MFS transporter, partial [Gemmatimonadales bacterium]
GPLLLAALLFIPASVLVGIGENFLGSFLPEIADEREMGRVSAIGFVMSYVGALILLGCVILAALKLGMRDAAEWRPLFVFAGVWFLTGILPSVFILRERARPARASGLNRGTLVGAGFRRLADTLHHLRRFRELARFFGVFFVFSMGTQVFIYLSGVITRQLGFSTQDLFTVAIELTVLAGVGAVFTAKYQDSLGHRRTIMIFLAVWFVSMFGLAVMAFAGPTRPVFYLLAAGAGLGLGGLNTASRALVGVFTPEHKSGEFFGLWGMMFKLSGAVAMGAFIVLESVVESSPGLFLLVTSGFFGVGLVGMLWVDERGGVAAAREAEREEAGLRGGTCPRCGYSTVGLALADRCPECGAALLPPG